MTDAILDGVLQRLLQAVEADPLGYLISTLNPTDADFALMGKLIQQYCYADLNARRIIDALLDVLDGPSARVASRLRDSEVFARLRTVADRLPDGDLKVGLYKAAETVDLHRVHRHNFAHWAARRLPDINALILFTKNAREAERRDGVPQAEDEMKYAVVRLDGFDVELVKLAGHSDYLAHQAALLENNLEVVRGAFQ